MQHNIVKRGIQHSYHPYNKINELEFYSHGRYFRLILTPRREVIHSKFKAYEVNGNGEEKTIHLGKIVSIFINIFLKFLE